MDLLSSNDSDAWRHMREESRRFIGISCRVEVYRWHAGPLRWCQQCLWNGISQGGMSAGFRVFSGRSYFCSRFPRLEKKTNLSSFAETCRELRTLNSGIWSAGKTTVCWADVLFVHNYFISRKMSEKDLFNTSVVFLFGINSYSLVRSGDPDKPSSNKNPSVGDTPNASCFFTASGWKCGQNLQLLLLLLQLIRCLHLCLWADLSRDQYTYISHIYTSALLNSELNFLSITGSCKMTYLW